MSTPSLAAPTWFRLGSRTLRLTLALLLSLLGVVVVPPAAHAASGSYFAGAYVSLFGSRDYHGYVPSAYRAGTPMPLLVALHGCTENDVGFDLLSGWSAEAERRGFIVVFPDQNNLANPAGCWNWTLPTNQHRGWGEPAIIAGITNRMKSAYTVDPKRIFVTGVSAGGVMANIMAVTYPDLYASASILAGCEYECDILQLRTPEQAGLDALAEMGSRARPVPVVIWQGTADIVVPPSTAYRIAGQWTTVGHTDNVADAVQYAQVPGGRTYTHLTYRTASGQSLVEQYMIDGAGHAYPGGCACSLYGDPAGPSATTITWDFFLTHPKP
ncbi:poly(hydroxyalkanoate) depolymerase family esterase [Hamadaea flava]|uniref:Alpha/beta hydrolase family esterase n=1 Tax=Hamadaea flava TaxID=1742688 RepID=A0ABV8LNR4_9ACTN|nr:PHB depolymerase family esterase [Hamadaea flava]MCP2329716.1 poly(hydroxyalkanoate) depolymerase family esterase [Hamadaea flava]